MHTNLRRNRIQPSAAYLSIGLQGSLRRAIYVIALLAVVAVLATAAFSKLSDMRAFEKVIVSSYLVPVSWSSATALLVVALEVLAAAGLLHRTTRVIASALAAALFAGFATFAIWRIYAGIPLSCGCFGRLAEASPAQSLLLNLSLGALSVGLIVATRRMASRYVAASSGGS